MKLLNSFKKWQMSVKAVAVDFLYDAMFSVRYRVVFCAVTVSAKRYSIVPFKSAVALLLLTAFTDICHFFKGV